MLTNDGPGAKPRRPARRVWTAAILAIVVTLAAAMLYARRAVRSAPAADPGPYDVLFISLDTVRQDALGCYGRRPRHAPSLSPSPALDALATRAVRMVDAYATSSWTLPSHMSMMTGLVPLVHAVETEGATLDPALPTMAEILHEHGYRTIGVYSAPYVDPHWGFGRGFDEYRPAYDQELVAAGQRATDIRGEIERAAAAADWPRYDELKRREVSIDAELNTRSQTAVTSDQVATDVVERLRTLARGTQPWLLFAHFFDAHCDYMPPPPYDRRFDPDYTGTFTAAGCMAGPAVGVPDPNEPGRLIRTLADRDLEHAIALYEGEVAWVDAHVGKILDEIDTLGLARRTLVVIVADHGEEFFEHGALGHRRTVNPEVIRVPMLLRLPGVLPESVAMRGLVSIADLLPTILDVLHVPAPTTPGSSSFLPLLRGDTDGAARTALARTVIMFGGEVAVDAGEPIPLRQVVVQDAFRSGRIEITRRRSWPQFRANVPPELRPVLQQETAAQYAREQLHWIDIEAHPDEPDALQSTDFRDPRARAALRAFGATYAGLLPHRAAHASKLPQNVRVALESLGYVEPATPGPDFPEPDVVLPPPRAD